VHGTLKNNRRLARIGSLVDRRQFLRFLVTGLTATVANLGAVWLVRTRVDYQSALLIGVTIGFCISFLLSKFFAFQSRSWMAARHEFSRFMIVYAFGILCYFAIAFVFGHGLLLFVLPRRYAELGGAFLGAGSMTFTSYFGHRFFTYGAH
jgi:putative flippase GtrA